MEVNHVKELEKRMLVNNGSGLYSYLRESQIPLDDFVSFYSKNERVMNGMPGTLDYDVLVDYFSERSVNGDNALIGYLQDDQNEKQGYSHLKAVSTIFDFYAHMVVHPGNGEWEKINQSISDHRLLAMGAYLKSGLAVRKAKHPEDSYEKAQIMYDEVMHEINKRGLLSNGKGEKKQSTINAADIKRIKEEVQSK